MWYKNVEFLTLLWVVQEQINNINIGIDNT